MPRVKTHTRPATLSPLISPPLPLSNYLVFMFIFIFMLSSPSHSPSVVVSFSLSPLRMSLSLRRNMCLVSHSFVYCVVVLVLKWYVLEFVLFMVVDNSLFAHVFVSLHGAARRKPSCARRQRMRMKKKMRFGRRRKRGIGGCSKRTVR